MLEFLTGRPMKEDENSKNWLLDQLSSDSHTLSDQQLWTLLVWVLAESVRLDLWSAGKWRQIDDSTFLIPADDKNSHFVKVSEIKFEPN